MPDAPLFILILLTVVIIAELGYLASLVYQISRAQNFLISTLIPAVEALNKSTGKPAPEMDKTNPGPHAQYQAGQIDPPNQLIPVLQELLRSLELFKTNLIAASSGDSNSTIMINRALDDMAKAIMASSEKIARNQERFLQEMGSHLFEQQTLLDELIHAVKTDQSSGRTLSSKEGPKYLASHKSEAVGDLRRDDEESFPQGEYAISDMNLGIEKPARRASNETQRSGEQNYDTGEGLQRFSRLREWIDLHIQHIMKKSMASWRTAEDLLSGAPTDLLIVPQILDKKVLLVGTKDCSQQLALVLPGSYIGGTYFDWFSVPKGTNERVEETIEPAIVQRVNDEFRVIQRGRLKQD
jgi:hypothetical protein